MKRIFLIAIITTIFTSCADGNDGSTNSGDTTKSITPPTTTDTATTIAPMMGDTSKTEADSLKK